MGGPFELKDMVLSPYETVIYVVCYLFMTVLFFHAAYQTTHRPDFENEATVSYDFLGNLVDRSCDNWQSLMDAYKLWWVLLLYVFVSKALRFFRLNSLLWSLACGILGIIFVFFVLGLYGGLFVLANICFHVITALVTRSRFVVWATHIAFLAVTSTAYYFNILLANTPPQYTMIMFAGSSLVSIRCLMFFDDTLRETAPLISKENACLFLHFMFYPPNFFLGPIYVYHDFKKALSKPVDTKYAALIFRAARIITWAFLLHFSFYIYYRTFLSTPYLVSEEDDLAFAGSLYLNGIRFYLLYIQAYGWPYVLGHFDGFDIPEWPRCISHIYSYAEMWKVFDRGLYKFIKWYIYIPLGGNQDFTKRLLSTAACFIYVVIYHGLHFNIFIWVLMNFVQVIAEVCLVKFYFSDRAKLLHNVLTPAWTRRLLGFLGAWSFMFSCIGFFYFDIGFQTTNKIFNICGTYRFWLLYLVFAFCMVQFAIECRVRGWYQESKNRIATTDNIEVPVQPKEKLR